MDVNALRWRAHFLREPLPSVGFGVFSGRTRRQALDLILDMVWDKFGGARPAESRSTSIPDEEWGDMLSSDGLPDRKRARR